MALLALHDTVMQACISTDLIGSMQGRVSVLFGLPDMGGVCKAQVEEYLAKAAALREQGVSKIFCVAVGSPAEVEGWYGKAVSGTEAGCIEPLADEDSAFTRMLGVDICDNDKPKLKNHRWGLVQLQRTPVCKPRHGYMQAFIASHAVEFACVPLTTCALQVCCTGG